ncbi:unnamed protein product, partial [Ixodes hexagonus]
MVPFNFKQLCRVTNDRREVVVAWCQDRGLLPRQMPCARCGENSTLTFQCSRKPFWRCQRAGHNWKKSITTDTFFEGCHLPIAQVLEMLFVITAGGATVTAIQRIASQETKTLSRKTIASWVWYFRDTCFRWIDEVLSQGARKIGGPGKVVEIDEAKVGKRKYHRGRLVEGIWILGMVELQTGTAGTRRRGGSVRLEVCPGNKRDTATLLTLIQRHVLPGTTIMTDRWAAYNSLTAAGYNHLTVNHSYHFVDPQTWANTQTIESQWRAFKTRHSHAGGTRHQGFGMHLCEFMWRREMDNKGLDPFLGFLETAAAVYPPGPTPVRRLPAP